MITVDYIGKMAEDKYAYYLFTNGSFSVEVFQTDFPALALKKINGEKAQSILLLCEQFRSAEKEIVVEFNKIYTYSEALTRISAFIQWGNQNISKEEEVIKYALETTNKMNVVYNEVPQKDKMKKVLLFLIHCVTQTASKRITI